MNLGIISVSYLNDCSSHAEWLHPFYSSLSQSVENSDLNVIQFIIQNDDNREEAKSNILDVISSYQSNQLKVAFLDSGLDYISDPDIHHSRALKEGLNKVVSEYGNLLQILDFITVEELDIVHSSDFSDLILDYYNFSRRFNLFFGVIGTGKYRMNYDYYGHEEDYIAIYDQPPRIAPVFLGFNTDMLDKALNLFKYFEPNFTRLVSEKSNSLSKKVKNEGLEFPFFVDELCGSDLFYEMISNFNFFHLQDDRPFSHIGGVTMDYKRILRRYKIDDKNAEEIDITKNKLEEKFASVKENFNLPFSKNSLFFNEYFEQDFSDLEPEKYNYG